MNIALTQFARSRHFKPDFRGTRILDLSPDAFLAEVNDRFSAKDLVGGYAPFCKHLFLENFSDAQLGVAEITSENQNMLQSGYEARTPDELPVLVRWFEGLEAPRALWLDVILYSNEQLAAENDPVDPARWGIVNILAVDRPDEQPMTPMTMLRNALGIGEGGSGVALDRQVYQKSVEFWRQHATLR
jgi:hypothetical protein